MHGKGKLYYNNKSIKYKGIFTNGKYGKTNKRIILYFLIASVALIISFFVFYIYPIKNENNQIIILNDFNYYIGEIKNGKPNGRGKKYNKSHTLIQEGDFVDGKYEGIGNLNSGNDEYYYSDFKNGEYNGKGILYKNLKVLFILSNQQIMRCFTQKMRKK